MKFWCAFYYSVPENNAIKVMKVSCAMILQLQLYVRSKIGGDALDDTFLCSDGGVDSIFDDIYTIDALYRKEEIRGDE